jgi:dTDP-4-amino-4,6-dideoxygalactose transaminase
MDLDDGDFPEAEWASKEVLSLPVFPELTQPGKDYIANMISHFFRCQWEGG